MVEERSIAASRVGPGAGNGGQSADKGGANRRRRDSRGSMMKIWQTELGAERRLSIWFLELGAASERRRNPRISAWRLECSRGRARLRRRVIALAHGPACGRLARAEARRSPTVVDARRHRWLVCGAVLALAGCASLPGETLIAPAGRAVEAAQIDGPAPTVVFESGLAAYKETWNKVFPVIAKTNSVFAYNRAGVGRSAPASGARDGAAIVDELRALLAARNLPPPYVLVGHSAGGLHMQLYARRFPGEVAGLVLVDSTHPTQFEGAGSMQNRSPFANFAVAVALTGESKAEFEALSETGREVLSAPPVRADLPIAILIAPDPSGSDVAAFDNSKRADFARLYPSAALHAVDGGHDLPQTNPQAVIDAIRDVLGAYARQARP
jgi:pimeloyl-ACP methyl ester carboxylesterase